MARRPWHAYILVLLFALPCNAEMNSYIAGASVASVASGGCANGEDLTTFTETDSGGDIAVTACTVTVSTMITSANSSVAKSYGADHFGSFTHYIDFNATDIPTTTPNYLLWAVGDESGMTYDDLETASNGLGIYAVNIASENRLYLRNFVSGTASSKIVINTSTTYYLKIERDNTGNSTKVTLYTSAANRTSDTSGTSASVTHSDQTNEYVAVACSYDKSGSTSSSFSVSNLDINE
jgi:hypothetical protein